MKEKEYILTISILASNRKDTLPKTLESIRPLLDNVSSELIVTDTGCDGELLDIIRQYTDKVIKFNWCNDFSKARNVSIDSARGEWYLFLDDDEWFEDVTEFIDFFNGNEKNQYGMGRYIQRNYKNFEGENWTDAVVGRLFRLNKGTHFKDAIHERPVNISGPVKHFTSYVHHYGYVYKTETDREAHRQRNLSLLLKQVEDEPTVARHYAHIAQEYYGAKQFEKVIDIVNKGIENIDMKTDDARKNVPGLYAFHISVLEQQKKYEELLSQGESYMKEHICNELGEAMLSGLCAAAAYNLRQYEKSLAYAKRFFELKSYIDDDANIVYTQSTAMLMYTFEQGNCANTVQIGILASVEQGDLAALNEFVSMLGKYDVVNVINARGTIERILKIVLNDDCYMERVSLFEELISVEHYLNALLVTIDELKEKDMPSFIKMAKIMAATSSQQGYVQYLRILSSFNSVSREGLELLYKKAVESIADIVRMKHEFWIIAASNTIDIQGMLNSANIRDWMINVDAWSVNAKVKELIEKKQDLDRLLKSDSIHMQYYDMVFIEALLFRKKLDNITLEELIVEMQNYSSVVLDFYKAIYTDDAFERFATVLPLRCQVALDIQKIACEKGNINISVRQKIEDIMPRWKVILDKYEELSRNCLKK